MNEPLIFEYESSGRKGFTALSEMAARNSGRMAAQG